MNKNTKILFIVIGCVVAVLTASVIILSISLSNIKKAPQGTPVQADDNGSVSENSEDEESGKLVRLDDREVGWIKIECPLCSCGEELTICPHCKGTGKRDTLTLSYITYCSNCDAFKRGYLTCPLCDNKFYIKMKDYTRDPDIPTPAELVTQVLELGPRPTYDAPCTYCNGGTNLKTCPECGGKKKSMYGTGCYNCTNGYVECEHCNDGFAVNESYKTEDTRWKLKLENILDGVVDKTKTEEEIQMDYVITKGMQDSLNLIIDSYNSSGSVDNSGSAPASMCTHCYGLGTCPTCYGDGKMKNSYTGNQQQCSSCGGGGLCSKCGGK